MYHLGSLPTFYHFFGGITGNTLDSSGTQCHSKHISCFRYRTQEVGSPLWQPSALHNLWQPLLRRLAPWRSSPMLLLTA
jgi:hypothetical protein